MGIRFYVIIISAYSFLERHVGSDSMYIRFYVVIKSTGRPVVDFSCPRSVGWVWQGGWSVDYPHSSCLDRDFPLNQIIVDVDSFVWDFRCWGSYKKRTPTWDTSQTTTNTIFLRILNAPSPNPPSWTEDDVIKLLNRRAWYIIQYEQLQMRREKGYRNPRLQGGEPRWLPSIIPWYPPKHHMAMGDLLAGGW